jgi:hypothetical protein
VDAGDDGAEEDGSLIGKTDLDKVNSKLKGRGMLRKYIPTISIIIK